MVDNKMLINVVNIIKNAYKSMHMDNIKVQKKELRDIATNIDIHLEKYIIDELQAIYPTHFFSSEERGRYSCNKNDIYEWIIDPIDGTINFASGLPFYTTSICLKRNDDLLLGIVYDKSNDDCYYAIKNQGAYLNEKRIRVSENTDINNSILTFMLTSHYNEKHTEEILEIVKKLSNRVRGMRLLVSQALELCYIACGKIDGTVCIKSRGFSSSAGVLILREAGGKATDLTGKEFAMGSISLLATNGNIHADILSVLKS